MHQIYTEESFNSYMDVVGMNRCVTGAAEDQVVHHLKTTREV